MFEFQNMAMDVPKRWMATLHWSTAGPFFWGNDDDIPSSRPDVDGTGHVTFQASWVVVPSNPYL